MDMDLRLNEYPSLGYLNYFSFLSIECHFQIILSFLSGGDNRYLEHCGWSYEDVLPGEFIMTTRQKQSLLCVVQFAFFLSVLSYYHDYVTTIRYGLVMALLWPC